MWLTPLHRDRLQLIVAVALLKEKPEGQSCQRFLMDVRRRLLVKTVPNGKANGALGIWMSSVVRFLEDSEKSLTRSPTTVAHVGVPGGDPPSQSKTAKKTKSKRKAETQADDRTKHMMMMRMLDDRDPMSVRTLCLSSLYAALEDGREGLSAVRTFSRTLDAMIFVGDGETIRAMTRVAHLILDRALSGTRLTDHHADRGEQELVDEVVDGWLKRTVRAFFPLSERVYALQNAPDARLEFLALVTSVIARDQRFGHESIVREALLQIAEVLYGGAVVRTAERLAGKDALWLVCSVAHTFDSRGSCGDIWRRAMDDTEGSLLLGALPF